MLVQHLGCLVLACLYFEGLAGNSCMYDDVSLSCRSLVALPVLAVALVAHPGIASCCAAAAATLAGKSSRQSQSLRLHSRTAADQKSHEQRSGKDVGRRARIYG